MAYENLNQNHADSSIFFSLWCNQLVIAQPPNDECPGATDISYAFGIVVYVWHFVVLSEGFEGEEKN